MSLHCDLQIHVNGQQTFFLDEKIVSAYSGRLKKIIRQEKRRTQIKSSGIEVDDFPGGSDGFELVLRFCYNRGEIGITASNVSLLHCCAVFLGMSDKVAASNLLQKTEKFLEDMFYWSWNEVIASLKSCETFLGYAESVGLLPKLLSALLAKIAQNSDLNLINSSSSSSSSPEVASRFRFSSSAKTTPDSQSPSWWSKAWWFDDLTVLSPLIIEKVVKSLGAYGSENNSLILTRFLLHYLKTVSQRKGNATGFSASTKSNYMGLADTVVHGVILVGKTAFSCRGLLRVLRIVSGFGISKDCRVGLERLIGGMLDQATLDDLLVSGRDRGVYDVNLAGRLIRAFVNGDGRSTQKVKRVARLVDKYLGEIAPDQNLKISKFLGVAESLPDSARDCYDGVYRAIDIFLESHPSLSFEERSRLCRCLNYEKLSLEACKDLAKNPKVPPRIAVQALMSQQSYAQPAKEFLPQEVAKESPATIYGQIVVYGGIDTESVEEENHDMRMNLQRMQWRVNELEKVCKQMRGQMSKIARHPSSSSSRSLPRLC
ncbi:uncharacterized protein J3R85_006699 [Psidium guajava]|nr:uncharacterized protein J3R85_006699 [Psidium guajava]